MLLMLFSIAITSVLVAMFLASLGRGKLDQPGVADRCNRQRAAMTPISRSCSAMTAAFLLGGCVMRLPAPPPPARTRPSISVPSHPPPAGHGRVIIESADGTSSVVHLIEGATFVVAPGGFGGALHVRRLCVTPCFADLPYGQHELRFTVDGDSSRAGEAYVNVSNRTSVLRVHLAGRRPLGLVAVFGGSVGVLAGLSTIGAGVGWSITAGEDSEDAKGFATATFVGVAVVALGAALWQLDKPIVQPASSLQWELESAAH